MNDYKTVERYSPMVLINNQDGIFGILIIIVKTFADCIYTPNTYPFVIYTAEYIKSSHNQPIMIPIYLLGVTRRINRLYSDSES